MNTLPTFPTEDAARDWLESQFDESDNITNIRFAFKDDAQAMAAYEQQVKNGSDGSFDADVMVNGRAAEIGCNYGA